MSKKLKYTKQAKIGMDSFISSNGKRIEPYLQNTFLWNAYARGVLTEEQYEIGVVLIKDGFEGEPLELVEAARKL